MQDKKLCTHWLTFYILHFSFVVSQLKAFIEESFGCLFISITVHKKKSTKRLVNLKLMAFS